VTEVFPDDELVTCLECGAQFRTIGSSHLKKHGMTIEQYRAKHVGAPLYPPGFLEQKGLAISKGWAKPGLKARMRKKRRELFRDPKRGKRTRAALDQGRTEPARAKAKTTMQLKAASDPNYSANMGRISRDAYANATPEELAPWNKNKQLAQLRPERRARQSAVATQMHAATKRKLAKLDKILQGRPADPNRDAMGSQCDQLNRAGLSWPEIATRLNKVFGYRSPAGYRIEHKRWLARQT
jgi:hypothetical protein